MLDTRNYDRSITTLGWNTHYITELLNHASRTLMGSLQENWYVASLFQPVETFADVRTLGFTINWSSPSAAEQPGVLLAARSFSAA